MGLLNSLFTRQPFEEPAPGVPAVDICCQWLGHRVVPSAWSENTFPGHNSRQSLLGQTAAATDPSNLLTMSCYFKCLWLHLCSRTAGLQTTAILSASPTTRVGHQTPTSLHRIITLYLPGLCQCYAVRLSSPVGGRPARQVLLNSPSPVSWRHEITGPCLVTTSCRSMKPGWCSTRPTIYTRLQAQECRRTTTAALASLLAPPLQCRL